MIFAAYEHFTFPLTSCIIKDKRLAAAYAVDNIIWI